MNNDFSTVTFDKNHKVDSAALEVIQGVRLLLASLGLSVLLVAFMLVPDFPGYGWVAFAIGLAGFASGAYGSFQVADGLGWGNSVGVVLVLSMIFAYVRLLAVIVLLVMGFNLIGKSSYYFTIAGAPRKR